LPRRVFFCLSEFVGFMPIWKHNRPKPVIGVTGGIGSGKSTISNLLAAQGCAVINSDALAHDLLQAPAVKEELRAWLGEAIITTDGAVSRKAVAARIFNDQSQVAKLNAIIHPRVAQQRAALMEGYMADPAVRAVIWDSPLLMETGLDVECDAIIFVKVPLEMRLDRVCRKSGWTPGEFAKREKWQISLDKKASVADYCIDNSGDEASSARQVQRVLSQLLAATG
jgi:dephospho-CoA kinase